MSKKLNLDQRTLHKTIEKVEDNLHKKFGFSTDRQKEFARLYSLCVRTKHDIFRGY